MRQMALNQQAFNLAGVTEEDYKKWCKENKKAAYLKSSKAEFFARIHDGRLVKDSSGNLIKKRRKSIASR